MTIKKTIQLLVGLVITGVFFWLVVRQVEWQEIKQLLRQANVPLVLSAIVVFFVGYGFRIERWRLMLIHDNPKLEWKDCSGLLLVSLSANNLLPFRLGDFLLSFGFNRQLGVKKATTLSSMIVIRLLDFLAVIWFLGLAVAYYGTETNRLLGIGGWVIILAAVAILVVLIFSSYFKVVVLWFCRLGRFINQGITERLCRFVEQIFEALSHLSKGRVMGRLIGYSLVAWFFEGLVFWLCALALPAMSDSGAAWLAMPVGSLATAIPSSPGYIGTFDYFTTQAMMVLGNSQAASTVFALLVHFVVWLPPIIAAGGFLMLNPRVIKSVVRDKDKGD